MKKTLFSIGILLIAGLAQSQAQSILSENFESGAMPAGWTQTTLATDGGWKLGVNAAMQSGGFQIDGHTKIVGTNDDDCNCNKSADRFISPVMDFSAYTAVYLSYDVYFFAGTSAAKTETLKLEVSTNAGANWTTIKTFTNQGGWKTITQDISAYVGQSSVMISFLYGDAGGHLFGAAFDNVNVYAPILYDMATISIGLDPYIASGSTPIWGTMFNNGSDTITSMDINYRIDTGAVITQNVSGLSILPLTSYTYIHPTNWNAVDSIRSVKVWASNLDGNPDTNALNDTARVWVSVVDTVSPRMVLFEEFASSTSTASASANPAFNSFLNTNASKAIAIKYQMSYPSPGDDPCFLEEGVTRHNYYRIPGIPRVQMDGTVMSGIPSAMTQAVLDTEVQKIAVYTLSINWSVVGSAKVFVSVTARSKGQILPTADLKLHVVAVENSVAHSAQSNGETTFYDVNRKMITGENGVDMPIDTLINQVFNFSGTWAILNVPGAPVDPTDLSIIAFIQDNSTGQVLQAASSTNSTGIHDIKGNDQVVSVYPNPFKGSTNVNVRMDKAEQVNIEIVNLVGEKVYGMNKGELSAGMHTVQVDGSSLPAGMYFVTVLVGEKSYTQKIILNK